MVWPCKKNRKNKDWKNGIRIKGSRKETYGMIQNEMVHSCTEIHQIRVERTGNRLKRKDCPKKEEIGDCLSTYLYKMETLLEEERGDDDNEDGDM